ncbi:MAG TPA: NAD-dependent deacylase [bacterium]|nr:NAD-dependent deacylase [bacterium]
MSDLQEVARILADARWIVALTGAGISVDSGIPDFRSPGGLWDRFDPMEYATIDAFLENPDKVWTMLKEMNALISNANPNPGHTALAELEQMGLLKAIITQNIDNLHQEAGSREVIEFHGNGNQLVCLSCGSRYSAQEVAERLERGADWPPECPNDMQVLKPNVIFFGEAIPLEASHQARLQAARCDAMLVVGTSAMVFPASSIPQLARQSGAVVVEINKTSTQLTRTVAQYTLQGSSSDILPALVEEIRRITA